MARRAASRHTGEALEYLLRGLFLDNRIGEGVHVLMNRHAHLLEREWQLCHEHRGYIFSHVHCTFYGMVCSKLTLAFIEKR